MLLDKSYSNLKKILLENMCLSEGSRVLDIGCGVRGNVYGIDPKAYVGIDNQGIFIKHLKESQSGIYHVMEAGNLKFDDKCFDYIISVSLLHHLSAVELKDAMSEVKRVLKKEGKVIVADGVYPESKFNLAGWLIRFFDKGRYVRCKHSLRELLTGYFYIEKEYYLVDKIFAYSLFVMSIKE
ncbi:MAG: class I SAM-dependent methyltransferase [Candidatus Omnitrophica bacterium]|nr:class I SAM-dependent methyltransferase [Candidatus Omnitrophota bacterium]